MAKNALIICNFRLRNADEFNNIVKNFKNRKYEVFDIGEIDRDKFDVKILENKINEIKNLNRKYETISVISNIKDVLFIWYRIYNNLVDNFIFFIDKINYSVIKKSENMEILNAIGNFKSIAQEELKGKIYININYKNNEQLFEFLFNDFKFIFFDRIENINYFLGEKNIKKIEECKKSYNSGENSLEFGNGSKIKEIDLTKDREIDRNIFFDNIDKANYFYPYYTLFVIKNYDADKAREILFKCFEKYIFKNDEEKEKIAELLFKTEGFEELSFKEKIGILSINFKMEVKKYELTTMPILNEIIKDNGINAKYYYYIMTNISLCGYYVERKSYNKNVKKVLELSKEYYKSKLSIGNEYKEKNKKILFIQDSLKGGDYSGTKLVFDVALNIKKYYPDYEITIYCEDNFFGRQDENLMVLDFNNRVGLSSTEFKGEHFEYLKDSGIKVVYSHTNKPKEERVKEVIEYAKEYKPEAVITTTIYSNSINILFELFPVIYISLAEINSANNFDLYLLPHIEHLKEMINVFGIEFNQNKMLSFDYGGNFEKAENIIERERIGSSDKEFLMISVGVRLKVDLKKNYVEVIAEFLEKHREAKWILVGETDIPIIDNNYKHLLEKQIIKVKYIKNLGEVYRACDLYLNPPRMGGGFSVAEAVANELCVLTTAGSPGGALHCGKENGVDDLNEYKKELQKLYEDKEYRKEKLKKEQEVQEGLSYKNIIPKLMEHIENAKKIYFERKGNINEETTG